MAERDPFVSRVMDRKRADGTPDRIDAGSTELIAISLPGSFRLQAVLVLILQLLIFVFLIVTLCVPINVRGAGYGSLGSKIQFLYITCVSVGATVVSTLAAAQLRVLYLKKLEHRQFPQRLQRANIIVGLGDARGKLRNWHISGSFVLVALISAGIISALTPDTFPISYPFSAKLYMQHTQGYGNDECFTDGGPGSVDGFVWKLANGSRIGVNATSLANCEPQRVLPALDQSNRIYLGDDLVYSMGGVPVAISALGAPFSVSQNTFSNAFGIAPLPDQNDFFSSLVTASVCLPMIYRNPVQCEISGDVFISGNNMTVSSNGCNATNSFSFVDPSTQGATVAGGCAGDEEGTATIVIGAANSHVQQLAVAMDVWGAEQKTFAVTCSVDLKPAIAVRRLMLTRYSKAFLQSTNYKFLFSVTADNSSSAPCEGDVTVASVSTSTALAVGASAAWQLLAERRDLDGRLVTLLDRCWNTFFDDGPNKGCLQDMLGVVSAMGIGMYWGSYGSSEPFSSPTLSSSGTYSLEALRVGPGQWWGIVYTLPLLFSIMILATLLWQTRRLD